MRNLDNTTPNPTPTWSPEPIQLLKMHPLRLEIHDIGAMVHIGCKSIAFSTLEEAQLEINNWLNNPVEVWKRYQMALNLEKIN